MGKRMVWGCPCTRGAGLLDPQGAPRVPLGTIIPPLTRPVPGPLFFQHDGHPAGVAGSWRGVGRMGGGRILGGLYCARRARGPCGHAPRG